VGVKVYGGSASDHRALVDSLMPAILNVQQTGDGTPVIEEATADKGVSQQRTTRTGVCARRAN
jgi:hypothetical protein